MFTPLQIMFERVRRYGESDNTLFSELLYAGEFLVKLSTAAFVCAMEDDRDGHRYRLIHGLVRTNSVGD
jgi:hypothetical protein